MERDLEKEGVGEETGEVTSPEGAPESEPSSGTPAPSPSPEPESPEAQPSDVELSPEEGGEVLAAGIYVYLGTTGVGKTYKAIQDALATQRATGQSLVILDSGGAENFEEIEHEKGLGSVIEKAWGQPGSLTVWTPQDEEGEEAESFFRAVRQAGHIILLVDEVSFWATSPNLRILLRVWRHEKLTILVTAQNVGTDLGQVLLACNPLLFLFRITAPRSIEWVMRWHGIDPARVRALPEYHFIRRRF